MNANQVLDKAVEKGILYTLQQLMVNLADKKDNITTHDIVSFVQTTLDELEENNRKETNAS